MSHKLYSVIGGEGPVVSPEVQAGLAAKHRSLSMAWHPRMKLFVVRWTWADTDPRRDRIKMGELSPDDAWDIVTFLPRECSPEAAGYYIERALRLNAGPEDWKKVADQVSAHNARQEQTVVSDALADVENRIELSTTSLRAHTGDDRPAHG